MEWHINDLSLQGQFDDSKKLAETLEKLLKLRRRYRYLHTHLYCSSKLSFRPAVGNKTLQHVVRTMKNRNLITQIMAWLRKSGPFCEDESLCNERDRFTYQTEHVTGQGLGEAAIRRYLDLDAQSFSFAGGATPFNHSPLPVQYLSQQQLIDTIPVPNVWQLEELEQLLKATTPLPTNWHELMQEAGRRFPHLIFSDTIAHQAASTPLSGCLIHGIFERLDALETVCVETVKAEDDTLTLSPKGSQRWQHLTVGEALFSDESDSNKRAFKQQMTFFDPSHKKAPRLFCPWHGKIQCGYQYRIHFQWPRPSGQKAIKVVYIGDKITKH